MGDVPDRHMVWVVALLSLIFACLGPFTAASSVERQRTEFLASYELASLVENTMPESLDPQLGAPISVRVVPQAGSMANLVGVKQAVTKSEGMVEKAGASRVLLVSPHRWGFVHALELRLVQGDWALRLPQMQYFVHAPWVGPLAMLMASLCLFWRSCHWLFLPLSAGMSQAMLAWMQKGTPWREIAVQWTAWPTLRYQGALDLWDRLVFDRPYLSVFVAAFLLLAAYLVSRRANAKQRSWSRNSIGLLAVWLLASVVWWDANLSSCIPFERLSFDGSGWLRISWMFRALAWVASGFLILRQEKPTPVGEVLLFPTHPKAQGESARSRAA